MATTWITSRELVFFVLYMAGDFENVCEIITDKASEDLEKNLAVLVYK